MRLLTRVCALSLLVMATVTVTVTVPAKAEESRPNVLFIAVDDLNDWIGCLGGHLDCKTPNIDRLAKRGVLFTRSYCTAPACNPSRASLLTGIRPSSSGVYLNPQPWRAAMPNAVTMPEYFKKNGYEVLGGGKIFHGSYPDDRGWHHYEKKQGDPKPSQMVLKDPHSRAGGVVWGVLDVPDSEMNDYKITSWATEELAKSHEKPFFLACGIYRPHMPWQVPRKYYEMYPPDKIALPKVPENDLQDLPGAGVKMAKPNGDHATILKTENWRYAVQAYLASITFADAQIGRLLDALDDSEHKDNTIVVLWGDHGWHLGEKQHWRKFALWEEATRAPLMMIVPGVTKPNSICERTVDFLSIYPTLVELCGLPEFAQLEGKSVVSLLKDPQAEWNQPAITTHGRNNHAVRSEQYRYIRYADGSEELYDHNTDPMEWTNLANDAKYDRVKRQLAGFLPHKNAPNAAFDETKVKPKKNQKKNRKE